MRGDQLYHIKVLLKRLGILLLLYEVCRLLFYMFNRDLFPHIPLPQFLGIMFHGLRFDIASIIYVNIIFILMHIIPNPWFNRGWYQHTLKILFYFFNGVALLLESGDFIYYRYGLKRTSTHELGLANDTSILPQVMKDYWIIFLIALLLIIGIEYLYRKTLTRSRSLQAVPGRVIHYPSQILIMVVLAGFLLIGARGGIQPKVISPNTATQYTDDSRLTSLIINTPFSVIYNFGHRELQEPKYFDDDKLSNYYSIYHDNAHFYNWPDSIQKPDQPDNICVIVLESFAKEYIGYFNHGKGYTPFLDSLLAQGLCYTNMYSNGKSSNQGIIAVTAGIPVLMEEPFISCIYQHDSIDGVGTLLSKIGYSSAFFHGANNGSMEFDRFMKQCGVQRYYGRNEFGDDRYYDGNWGIFDEPFLKWTANKMSTLPEPFYSEIFTISSHHPYTVPPEHTGQFKKGPIPMLEVIGYADYSLQQFFAEAEKQPWFKNTLFILTADHPGPPIPGDDFYQQQVGAHATWLLLYKANGQFRGTTDMTVQQSDIMPTVLDYAGYTGKFMAFGNSVFDSSAPRYAFDYHATDYVIIDSSFALQFNGVRATGLYAFKQDSSLTHNLMDKYPEVGDDLENRLKAIIQIHDHAMIHNQLTPQ